MNIELEQIQCFFGWSAIINMIMLMIIFLLLTVFKTFVLNIHAKLFKIEKETLPHYYFSYLALYKLLNFFFNIVPFIALKLVTN
ncbi:MAG: DUF6868 family protein [Bacteriovoracaceae bacterium]